MPYGLYISAEGAQAQSRRLEVIANNLANVDTPGFKRDLALFKARFAEATNRGLDQPGSGTVNDVGGGVLVRETATDYTRGPIKPTDIPTDLAIDGDGFFLVERDGQTLLTRSGNFSLTADGELVTQDGYHVLDSGGSPVAISPDAGPWRVTLDGAVEQGGERALLALVHPPSLDALVKAAENLFVSPEETTPVRDEERRIRQGYLESSGVRPTIEMMDMITTSRAFEANVSLIRNQDEMLGQLISRVLRVG